LQGKVLAALSATPQTAEQIAETLGAPDEAESVYLLLEHLAANGRVRLVGGDGPGQTKFRKYESQ
jgi:glucose-6-phosphate isomerase